MNYHRQEIQEWLSSFRTSYKEERGFQIRAHQYGVKEAWRMQEEDEYLSEIACDLMDGPDPEDRRPKSRRPESYDI